MTMPALSSPAESTAPANSPSKPTPAASLAVEAPAIVAVRNDVGVTTAVKAILAWLNRFFATEPPAPDTAWFERRLIECPPPAVSFTWGAMGGSALFQAFALALAGREISDHLEGPISSNSTADKLWSYCRQDILWRKEKPTQAGFIELLRECNVDVAPEPAATAGPAPDPRLANLCWSAIIKHHADTDEPVTHADLYARIKARQLSIRAATAWLARSGKIVREKGGFLPHAEDRE